MKTKDKILRALGTLFLACFIFFIGSFAYKLLCVIELKYATIPLIGAMVALFVMAVILIWEE